MVSAVVTLKLLNYRATPRIDRDACWLDAVTPAPLGSTTAALRPEVDRTSTPRAGDCARRARCPGHAWPRDCRAGPRRILAGAGQHLVDRIQLGRGVTVTCTRRGVVVMSPGS